MSKARRLAVRPAGQPSSDINVTPLVDVVLVLLIIFMVVTPLLEKDITVRVPATEQVQEVKDVPPDQLVVRLTAAGELSINAEKVEAAQLIERLKGAIGVKAPGDRLVFVMAEDGANYGRLVAVLDAAKQAGAETLGMMTEIPGEKPPTP
jgi:biopolymer transport protein ExbD